jgi:osmotically inducible protein OsmC
MAAIERTASGVWRGDLKTGSGAINATSGVLRDTPFSYATRFENARGTNPEELSRLPTRRASAWLSPTT